MWLRHIARHCAAEKGLAALLRDVSGGTAVQNRSFGLLGRAGQGLLDRAAAVDAVRPGVTIEELLIPITCRTIFEGVVVGEVAGLGEDDAGRDLDGVVGESFVEPAQLGDVDNSGDAVFPLAVNQNGEQVAVQVNLPPTSKWPLRKPQLRQPLRVEAAEGRQAVALLAALNTACASVDDLGHAAAELFQTPTDYAIITSFLGLADSTGARVLAEIGDDRIDSPTRQR